ncbi:MAG TPA: beta-ketoacyl-[acyl-carrier-protein] synthase family protein [Streptosporangiaceae bacterium]|nr:beta-ketoacyl-[acyl-carrier-protein] synthase family protein [Streptosporangiaceae bacterium]
MSNSARQVVVTGLGAVTPLGEDVSSTWAALLAGKSGVCTLSDSWADELPVRIAAPVRSDPAALIPSHQLRRMDRSEQLALIAARQAWQDAGAPEVEPHRLGVSIATTGLGGLGVALDAYDILRTKGWRRLSPFTLPMFMPNGAAAWIGIEFGARAGVHTPASACASGAEAIGYGMHMIRSGRADVVIVGGAEAAIHPLTFAMFAVMRAVSCRNDDPERASRPFDKARDGFVLGEGAGMMVLESAEHAARRGADVLAVAAGVGYSADAYDVAKTAPDGAGSVMAIQQALADADITPEHVVHINAHATSTLVGDAAEAMAISQAIGTAVSGIAVSATKSMTGHLLGGAGAIEAVATICALRDSVAPPTINLEDPDDEIIATGINIAAEPRELRSGPWPAVALSNSYGFGGHNVTLAFMTV